MRKLAVILLIALLAACSADGPNRQIPVINGVPIAGTGIDGAEGQRAAIDPADS